MPSDISQNDTPSWYMKIPTIKETIRIGILSKISRQIREASKQLRNQPYENKRNSEKTQEKETCRSTKLILIMEY